MARDGHDYDMGCHAPWCAKCGAEEDARQDAEADFDEEKEGDLLLLVRQAREALTRLESRIGLPTHRQEIIGELLDVVSDMESTNDTVFEWKPSGYDYDGPDTLEEARGDA